MIEPYLLTFLGSYYRQILKGRQSQFNRDGTSLNASGEACADTVMYTLRSRIEAETGLDLYPTFSFVRLYKKGDVLRKHIDQAASEVNVSITILASDPWPLAMHRGDEVINLELDPGDGVIFHGMELVHEREKFAGREHLQLIVAYVEKGGANQEMAFYRMGEPTYAPTSNKWGPGKKFMRYVADVREKRDASN
ncbi:MAG: hypothetical protein QF790_08640 [Gammaproteobacteria bacterium]|nr:hypothetical protein [Gammaproteobacteria bacterium]MDP6617214.1 hypothetical protein [Gammaproteobacteria bacterium]MDP6695801.1 hypothetical protein [Gammaproteobacteria bacterium]